MDDDNTLAAQTRRRVEAGVALYEAGAAPRIHFTGGSPRNGRPGAGEQMRALAVSLGVPAAVTSAESLSQSTLQNALFSRPCSARSPTAPVMLVTDGFHLARAWASFRWAGYGPVRLAAATAFGDQRRPATSSAGSPARRSPGGSTSPASAPTRWSSASAAPLRSRRCADREPRGQRR